MLSRKLKKFLFNSTIFIYKLVQCLKMVSKAYIIIFYYDSSFIKHFKVVIKVFKLFPMLWLEEVFFYKHFCLFAKFILITKYNNSVFAIQKA